MSLSNDDPQLARQDRAREFWMNRNGDRFCVARDVHLHLHALVLDGVFTTGVACGFTRFGG